MTVENTLYFMINLHKRMSPNPAGIEPVTPDFQVGVHVTEPVKSAYDQNEPRTAQTVHFFFFTTET